MKKRVRKPKGPKGPPKTRWEKSADRENERRRAKAPLFFHAGLVPKVTPEEREARFGPAFQGQIEREDLERIQRENERGGELRERVRAIVSAEKFAELEERTGRWLSVASYYGPILDELVRDATSLPEPAPARLRVRRLPILQEALFLEVPGHGEVPAVIDGKAIPHAVIAAELGVDVDAPPCLPPPVPCPDCGWLPKMWPPASKLELDVHPMTCPSLRAVMLGLRENCAACRVRHHSGPPNPPCEAHRARALACQAEGCVPGPDPMKKDYTIGREFCQRCLSSMQAAPYMRLRAA